MLEAVTNPTFLFFGCSWTYGKNINLIGDFGSPDPSDHEAQQIELYSYRSLVTKYFNSNQINYSQGASSNDRQFRLASEHFFGPPWQPYQVKKDNLIVLWFITSTARKEFYNATNKTWENIMLGQFDTKSQFHRAYLTDYYDHKKELEKISQQMMLWNNYFANNGIKNLWIDTFNHHDYPLPVKNRMCFESKFTDLMSNLCIISGYTPEDNQYHYSNGRIDDNRSKYLSDAGILNTKTYHPTQEGHRLIAEKLLIPQIQKII
jgi:hypothetical protein